MVFTDSHSVVTALNTDTNKNPWIQAIQQDAPALTAVMWIPGHCGIPGNVTADNLAATGRRGSLFTNETPGSDLKNWIARIFNDSWAADWGQNRTTALRKIKGDIKRWNDPKQQKDQRVLTRIRTGHTRFSHRFQGGGPFHIRCPTCDTHNTPEHVLINCQQFVEARKNNDIPPNLRDALSDDPPITIRVLKFFKDIKLFHET